MSKLARFAVVALILALGAAGVARAELTREGNLLLSFGGGISPKALPRSTAAPVAVRISSTIKALDGADPPPQLQQIAIGINRDGKLFDRGLPTCKVRKIQPATTAAARRICAGAIVGSGHVAIRVALPKQKAFTFKGRLLAFKARRFHGQRRILTQVYGRKPPSSFVLPFRIDRAPGTFGTVLKMTLPKAARKWAYITRFDMKLQRRFTYRGKRRSYVSAACPAPAGFPGAVYQFARAKYTFAGGRRVTSTLTRNCKVR